jgi:hypothetical protein
MSTPDKPFDYLDPTVLRRLFNDQQIPEKAIAGDLREEIRPQTHLSAHRRARLTIRGRQAQACTHTCIVTYLDWYGKPVAICHCYWRREKFLTRPDPKWMDIDGHIYRDDPEAKSEPWPLDEGAS